MAQLLFAVVGRLSKPPSSMASRCSFQSVCSTVTTKPIIGKSIFSMRLPPSQRDFSIERGSAKITPGEAGKCASKLTKTKKAAQSSMGTLLSHAGVDTSQGNAPMSPPLHLASTYIRPPDGPYHENDSIYSRMDNPTRLLLERTMGELECHGGANDSRKKEPVSCAFSSGMAAVSGICLAHKAPITVLLPEDVYHGVPSVLVDVFNRHGITTRTVDYTDLCAISAALSEIEGSEDVIVWMETPSNPLCQVIDVAAVCKLVCSISSEANVTTVVDSTMAPPCVTQPLLLGADVVIHSATKYLGGHSDVLLGVLTASPWTDRGIEIGPVLKQVQISTGSVASPFDSWLTMRGMRTLHIRLERQCQTALSVAQHLEGCRLVTKVHYPGITSHPQHEVAKRQMSIGYGGVLSFELESEAVAMAVAGALRTVSRATSLGGTETLIEHRASIEPLSRVTSPPGLLRISVGLEEAHDIIFDLDNALSIADKVVLARDYEIDTP